MYQNAASGDISSLLRLIQEEKATSVLANPPASEPGAPIRGVVQEPLKSPEAPGGSRVVSTPAEAVVPGGMVAPGGVVAPIAPVAPMAPVAPVSAPSMPRISAPSIGGSPAPQNSPQGSTSPVASPMSRQVLGTTIKPNPVAAPKPTFNLNQAVNSGGLTKSTPMPNMNRGEVIKRSSLWSIISQLPTQIIKRVITGHGVIGS